MRAQALRGLVLLRQSISSWWVVVRCGGGRLGCSVHGGWSCSEPSPAPLQHPCCRRKGIAQEALRLMMAYAVQKLGVALFRCVDLWVVVARRIGEAWVPMPQ